MVLSLFFVVLSLSGHAFVDAFSASSSRLLASRGLLDRVELFGTFGSRVWICCVKVSVCRKISFTMSNFSPKSTEVKEL